MDERLKWLTEVAAAQRGALLPSQLDAAGLTRRERLESVHSGVLQRVGTHVLRSPFVEPTPLAELSALLLDCGPGAVASGPTAAAVHQLDGFLLTPPFHVLIPRGRNIHRPGHRIHTTLDLEPLDVTRVSGVAVLTVPRCLVTMASSVGPAALTAAYDSAIRDRRTTEDSVHERIVALRGRGRYGIPKLLAVIEGGEATRGGHSWLERRFLRICDDAGLPRPMVQRVVSASRGRLVRVDFAFPGTPVIVEVLGYRWHRGDRQQMSRDVERLNALVLDGFAPMQFTYDHVTAEPGWVAQQVREALRASV